ncbi:hypothetical protein Droror1_Dr00013519 [Drosera rotundifolia]
MLSFNAINSLSSSISMISSSCSISRGTTARCFQVHLRRVYSAFSSGALMEVVKTVAKHGAAATNAVAIIADKKSYSYRQLVLSAQNIASILSGGYSGSVNGVNESGSLGGARVGIVAKPSAEFVAGILGTWLSGGVAVPLALSYPEAELLHVMDDSDISMILSTEEQHDLMKTIASKHAATVDLIPPVPSISLQDLTEGHLGTPEPNGSSKSQGFQVPSKTQAEDAALILYTSGTTGKPKGVVHTHKSILAQVRTLSEAWGYSASDQFLHCLPLHHILE